MSLQPAVEGARHTAQTITFARADEATQNLTDATITATIRDVRTGIETAATGTFTLVTATSGIFSWAYSAGDVATAGQYQVQFKATYADLSFDRSEWQDWIVLPAPASVSTQPRPTLGAIIQRVRDLLGPCSDAVTDIQIQDRLDRNRIKCNLLRLERVERVMPAPNSGQVRYYEFSAPFTDWERGYTLQLSGNSISGATSGEAWQAVTPSVANDTEGRWTFSDYYYSDVFISGFTYDIFAAAASCIDLLMAGELRSVTFSAGGQTFQRQQILQNYRQFARDLRSQARMVTADMVRGDN